MTISRNAPCSCGSGKKYRKCCRPVRKPHISAKNKRNITHAGNGWGASCYSCDKDIAYLHCCYKKDKSQGKLPLNLQAPKAPGNISITLSQILHFVVLLILCGSLMLLSISIVTTAESHDIGIISDIASSVITKILAVVLSWCIGIILASYFVTKLSIKCPQCWGDARVDGLSLSSYSCRVCLSRQSYLRPSSASDLLRMTRL